MEREPRVRCRQRRGMDRRQMRGRGAAGGWGLGCAPQNDCSPIKHGQALRQGLRQRWVHRVHIRHCQCVVLVEHNACEARAAQGRPVHAADVVHLQLRHSQAGAEPLQRGRQEQCESSSTVVCPLPEHQLHVRYVTRTLAHAPVRRTGRGVCPPGSGSVAAWPEWRTPSQQGQCLFSTAPGCPESQLSGRRQHPWRRRERRQGCGAGGAALEVTVHRCRHCVGA